MLNSGTQREVAQSHQTESVRSPSKVSSFLLSLRTSPARSRLIPAGVSKCLCTCFPGLLSLGSGFYTAGSMEAAWM